MPFVIERGRAYHLCLFTCECTRALAYIYIHASVCTCIFTYIHTQTHKHPDICIHTHMQSHTHAYTPVRSQFEDQRRAATFQTVYEPAPAHEPRCLLDMICSYV